MKKSRESQSGRSMIEMLGVIAIIGVITVGSIATVSYVDNYFRTTAVVLEIDKQANDIADLYSWSDSFPDTDTLKIRVCKEDIFVCKENKLPPNMWGGDIILTSTSNTFTITYKDVPQVACERIFDAAHNDNSFRYVTVKMDDEMDEEESDKSLCSKDTNDIAFEYSLH